MKDLQELPKKIPKTVKVLGVVSLLNDISTEMIYPVVPVFLTAVLGAPVAIVGLIEGVAAASSSFLKFFGGWLSDKIGKRKPLVILGYSFSTLSKPFFAFAATWPIVLLGRMLDRAGKGLRTSARDAWIADVTSPEIRGRSFGFHRMLDTTGAVIGPLLTVILLPLLANDYRQLFTLAFIPGALAVCLVAVAAKEKTTTKPVASKIPKLGGWKHIPRKFWIFLAFAALFGLANSSNAFLILKGTSLGWSASAAILAYALYNITYALASYPAGALSDRIPRKNVFAIGIVIFALSYLAFAFTSQSVLLWPIFALYGLASAFTDATSRALIADTAPKEMYGAAFGAYDMTISLATLISSVWFGLVWQFFGSTAAFAISSGLAAVAAAGILLSTPKKAL